MAMIPNFLGGSYPAASVNAALDRTVNLYPEVLETGAAKSLGMLRACPGLATALLTLPTSPLRGLQSGGAPLTTGGRLFAVAGSILYEVFADGTHSTLGDVGTDGKRAQIFLNGQQLWVVSNGTSYLHDGVSLSQPRYIGYQGTVDTSGTAITWVSGSKFDAGLALQTIVINGTPYSGTVFVDDQHLIVGSSAGTQSGVPYVAYVTTGTVNQVLTHVTWVDGPQFTGGMAGQPITIGGLNFTVASVQDPTHLTLSGSLVSQTNVLYSTPTLGAIAAATGAFLGGYFIAAAPDSKQFNTSDLYDGKNWDPLDFDIKASYPDNIGSVLADHDELWLLGESTTEVWGPNQNITVANTFPFAQNPTASMPVGIAAPASAASSRQGPVWIGADLRGQPVCYRSQGFQPVRVSDHAVESAWGGYSTIADAEAFIYELDGHEFYQVTFPTADATWVYDFTASQQLGRPMWHERQSWDGSALHRHRARCHAFVWGKHWVGDYSTGAIYEMSSAQFTDAGQTIFCIRTFQHLCQERLREFFHRLQVDLETGAAAITVKLEWSNDGGHTFPSSRTITIAANDGGGNPNYAARAIFNRLGSARDRVFRLTVSGNCRIALINGYLDSLQGIS
jgi:hypothetical protein